MSDETALACLTPEQLEDDRLVAVVANVGRPPPFSPLLKNFGQEHKDWVCAFLSVLPSPTLCASILGCSTGNLYDHRDRDPAFKAGWQAATENAHDTILGAAAEEALGIGRDHVVTKDGGLVAVPKRRSERLFDAWLKFRLGERHIHEGGAVDPGSMVIQVTPSQLDALTRDDRRELTRLLAKVEAAADGRPTTVDVTPEPAAALEHDG